jgi:nucleoside-diphosphate-sugar epimerase
VKALIEGGNGYIGSHLYSILEKQASVASIDYGNCTTEKDFINLDLTNIDKVIDFAANCDHFDVLIFLVGLAHAKGKGKDLPEFKKLNYQTLVNLLSALENNNKIPHKIIFSSTISIYGEKYNQSIYTEDSGKMPFSPYAVTKLEAEQYLLDNYADKSWILRFAPVYSSDFLLNINRRIRMGSKFYRVGKGSRKLSLCNIENIEAVFDAIVKDKVPASIYNISDPKEYTYNELLQWQNASWVIPIPVFAVKLLYYLGKFINSTFLRENTIKLISDNSFPSEKICSYVVLPSVINDVIFDND